MRGEGNPSLYIPEVCMSAESFLLNLAGSSVLVLLLAFVFVIRLYMIRRAITQVIEIFRERRSLSPSDAKTVDELGLAPPDFIERIVRRKDYKPYALQVLIRLGIVREVGDGKVCMSEERLRDVMAGAAP
jgi:hypothetical protein